VSATGNGKVVVNRAMSLDGFIAGPGDSMDWGPTHLPPDDVAAIAAETGAMLVGRRTWDVGAKMEAEDPGSTDYPFSGAMFLLSHRPLDPPDPRVSVLSGDIGDAVSTALDAAGDKNLEILGANVAAQCFQRGLVDEVLVYVLAVLLGASGARRGVRSVDRDRPAGRRRTRPVRAETREPTRAVEVGRAGLGRIQRNTRCAATLRSRPPSSLLSA
jgi:dihydrofolate reductase